MTEPRASVTRFVRAAARAEREGGASEQEVAQRMLQRLYRELGKLIGSLAFDVLLARSVVLARREHPALASVASGPGAALSGLEGADASLSASALGIVFHFVELLVALIGEDLALRLVQDAWPAVVVEEEPR